MGIWGGSTEFDRMQLRHLPQDEQVAELERMLQARLQERLAAWQAHKRTPIKTGSGRAWTRRDKRIAAMLGLSIADLVP
jgi:hypothetical protein